MQFWPANATVHEPKTCCRAVHAYRIIMNAVAHSFTHQQLVLLPAGEAVVAGRGGKAGAAGAGAAGQAGM